MHAASKVVVALLLAGAVGACGLVGVTSGLPSNPAWHGGCRIKVGHVVTLHGSATDPRMTWAIDQSSGERLDLLWPVGYRVRFSPGLEVLSKEGVVVGREGDLVVRACRADPADEGPLRVDASDVRPPTWPSDDG